MAKTRRKTPRSHATHPRRHPAHGSHKVSFLIIGGGAFLTLLLIILQGLLANADAQTFQGPGTSAGTGQGAIGVNATKNLSVGTSTPLADTKLLIVASSTAANGFPLKVLRPDNTVLFVIGNDGRLGAGGAASSTYIFTVNGDMLVTGALQSTNGYTGTMTAGNVSAGQFGANTGGGNYNFPGSVGIGTTTPAYPLHVIGGGKVTSNFTIGDATGLTIYPFSNRFTTTTVGLEASGSGVSLGAYGNNPLILGTNGANRIYITGTGSISLNGTTTVAADLYANAFYYNSDERLKTALQPADGLDTILKLNGVAFDWKKDGRRDVGLIAQDVEKVLPELVSTDAATGLKSVKYGNLVAPLIEAVKELNARIEAQDSRIRELEHEIQTLRSE